MRRGKPPDAAELAERVEPLVAAGQQLVRVGLVAGVPDDPVARRLEQAVEGERQLDHAERRAEVAAGRRDRLDDRLADLLGQLGRAAARSGREGRPGPLEGREDRHGAATPWLDVSAPQAGANLRPALEAIGGCRAHDQRVGPGSLPAGPGGRWRRVGGGLVGRSSTTSSAPRARSTSRRTRSSASARSCCAALVEGHAALVPRRSSASSGPAARLELGDGPLELREGRRRT